MPHHIFLNLINGLNLFPFKGDFSFWKKPAVTGRWVWTVGKQGHLDDLMFHQKSLHDTWCVSGWLLWWSCQSPVVHSCSVLNHLNRFHRGIFNAKFDADSALNFISYFECGDHTLHMLTQWHLPPPLTSTVKWSLFTHVHSSPLSLAARWCGCHSNCSNYINNGWAFSGQTLCVCVCVCVIQYIDSFIDIIITIIIKSFLLM